MNKYKYFNLLYIKLRAYFLLTNIIYIFLLIFFYFILRRKYKKVSSN